MLLTLPRVLVTMRLPVRAERLRPARAKITRWQALFVKANATRELPLARGKLVVHCRAGVAWITHDGDPRDIVLPAGESHLVDCTARMTVHAMRGDCALELQLDV